MMAFMAIFVYLCMKDDIVLVNIAFSGTTYDFTGYFTRPSWEQLTSVRTLVKMLKGKNFVLTGVVIILVMLQALVHDSNSIMRQKCMMVEETEVHQVIH